MLAAGGRRTNRALPVGLVLPRRQRLSVLSARRDGVGSPARGHLRLFHARQPAVTARRCRTPAVVRGTADHSATAGGRGLRGFNAPNVLARRGRADPISPTLLA